MKKRVACLLGLMLSFCMILAAAGTISVRAASLPDSVGKPKDVTLDHCYNGRSAVEVKYKSSADVIKLMNQDGNWAFAQIDWKFSRDDNWKYNPAWDKAQYSVTDPNPVWECIDYGVSDTDDPCICTLFPFYDTEDYWWQDECGWSSVVPSKYLTDIELHDEKVCTIDWNKIGVDVRVRFGVRHEEYDDNIGEYSYTFAFSDWSDTISFGDFSSVYDEYDNLLVNPDFEEGMKGWKNPDKCWFAVVNSDVGNARHGRFQVWPVTGSAFLQGDCEGESTRIYQDVDISGYKADETVVFKTFICNYDQAPHDMGKVVLTFLDKDGKNIKNSKGKNISYTQTQRNPNWNVQTIICSIPEGAATVRVSLYACRYVGSDVDAYYDFCSLTVKNEKIYPVTVTEKNNKSKVKSGDKIQLFANNTKTDKASDFTWSSSYNTGATVDANGLVTFHTDAEDGLAIYATDKNSGVTGTYWFNSDEENALYSGSGDTGSKDTGKTGSGDTESKDTGKTGSGDTGSKDTGKTGSDDTGSNDTGKQATSGTKAPKAATISKLVKASKAITVKWKKVAGVSGYEIRYSTKKNMSTYKVETVKKASTVKKVLLNLLGGKKYYVQIRTFKTVNGKQVYSDWSASKTVTTKK